MSNRTREDVEKVYWQLKDCIAWAKIRSFTANEYQEFSRLSAMSRKVDSMWGIHEKNEGLGLSDSQSESTYIQKFKRLSDEVDNG